MHPLYTDTTHYRDHIEKKVTWIIPEKVFLFIWMKIYVLFSIFLFNNLHHAFSTACLCVCV